jgi:hypothetical protein
VSLEHIQYFFHVEETTDTNIRSSSSPNQESNPTFSRPVSNGEVGDNLLDDGHLRMFANRLQPQQWLGPASMTWVSDLYVSVEFLN